MTTTTEMPHKQTATAKYADADNSAVNYTEKKGYETLRMYIERDSYHWHRFGVDTMESEGAIEPYETNDERLTEEADQERSWRNNELLWADHMINNHLDRGLPEGEIIDLKNYRIALRDYPQQHTFPAGPRPERPVITKAEPEVAPLPESLEQITQQPTQ